jgi:ketosteroid isomerase-like protein
VPAPSDVVRGFYEALNHGDIVNALSHLDPHMEWTEAERFPYYGGTWHGREAVRDNLIAPLARDWDGFRVQPHEFIAQGERVVTLGTYTGTYRATGRSLSAAFAHVWTVRGGKLVRFDMHTDTAKVLEAISDP